jgi:energy-coupling factor transport system permease protein
MTTPTGDLAYGITRLSFNYKTAHIITSTLNILPSFEEDARQLIDARRLRGVMPPGGKKPFAWFIEYPRLALPLMIKAMRRASAAGLAMDARAFGAYRRRTWLHETKMSAVDFTALACGLVYAAVAITANYILK